MKEDEKPPNCDQCGSSKMVLVKQDFPFYEWEIFLCLSCNYKSPPFPKLKRKREKPR